MKAIIPLAGKGTRLRPHTLTTPKPLVHVAGKPVMSYILDEFPGLGITEVVFIVGYLGDEVRRHVLDRHPELTAHFVTQEVQDGTAGAIKLAEPFIDEDALIVFVDTLFDADLSLATSLDPEWSGVIWAKEVEDYHRFGVIVTDDSGAMTRIVEKPDEPISRLANIGLYYIRDTPLLFEGIDHVLGSSPGPSGEYYLTDAFQYMVDQGSKIRTAPVAGWYDCGRVETVLDTNRHLLETGHAGLAPDARLEAVQRDPATLVESGAEVRSSTLGAGVTLEPGARVEGSSLENCIVGEGAVIRDSELADSIVGARAVIEGVRGRVSVGPYTEVSGRSD
ncbi:MAG: sugar phosphate nucleotidyltransferase [Gemmatimonadota bacterium]